MNPILVSLGTGFEMDWKPSWGDFQDLYGMCGRLVHQWLLVQPSTKGLGISLLVLIHTLLTWRYSLIISWPFSRPRPERL